jgi:hypothetical protein
MRYSLYVGNRYESRELIGSFETHSELLAIFHNYRWTHDNKIFCHYFEVMNENDRLVYSASLVQFLSGTALQKIAQKLGV